MNCRRRLERVRPPLAKISPPGRFQSDPANVVGVLSEPTPRVRRTAPRLVAAQTRAANRKPAQCNDRSAQSLQPSQSRGHHPSDSRLLGANQEAHHLASRRGSAAVQGVRGVDHPEHHHSSLGGRRASVREQSSANDHLRVEACRSMDETRAEGARTRMARSRMRSAFLFRRSERRIPRRHRTAKSTTTQVPVQIARTNPILKHPHEIKPPATSIRSCSVHE